MIIDVHVHALPRRGQDTLPEVTRQSRTNGLSLALVSIGGSISQYPDEDEVRRCNDEARDFAERSHGFCRWLAYLNPQNPNWRLDDPEHAEFFRVLAERGLSVWVTCALADDRTRHSGLACRPVAAEEVTAFCESVQENDYVFQGLLGDAMARVLERRRGDGRFRFEMSRLTDSCYAWESLVSEYGISQLVMGSEFPLRHLHEVRWTARRI